MEESSDEKDLAVAYGCDPYPIFGDLGRDAGFK
jgi:hypothetical protein